MGPRKGRLRVGALAVSLPVIGVLMGPTGPSEEMPTLSAARVSSRDSETPKAGRCPDGTEPTAGGCTHGPDPVPPGKRIDKDVAPLAASRTAAAVGVCDGDGSSGNRVQVMYVHASDVASRYSSYLASIKQWAVDADTIYSNGAAETGGVRHIRFVHDGSCAPTVISATIAPTADDTFDGTIDALVAQGYNRSDRKYMLFVDANVYCGIGNVTTSDSASSSNPANFGPHYGRSDSGCWDGHTAAHELMHNLGGVQLSAPHTSGGWHCTDEYDVMCYSDEPNYPTLTYLCSAEHLDCNHDDYYNTAPAGGSYLATHWNAANSAFLTGGGTTPTCPDQSLEPDESYTDPTPITVGLTSSRAFCAASEYDWSSFLATGSTTYTIETSGLSGGTDTYLDLFASNGTTILASDDDGGTENLASRIQYNAPQSGTLYVRTRNFDGSGSSALTYNLLVSSGGSGGVPNMPTGLIATPVSRHKIRLNWIDNSNNEDGFSVYIGANYIGDLAANAAAATVTGLARNTKYCFRVDAFNAWGRSAKSTRACARTRR